MCQSGCEFKTLLPIMSVNQRCTTGAKHTRNTEHRLFHEVKMKDAAVGFSVWFKAGVA